MLHTDSIEDSDPTGVYNDSQWTSYREALRRHYATVIEPRLRRNVTRDDWLFRIAWYLTLTFSAVILVSTPDPSGILTIKIIIGFSVWSFLALLAHLNFHRRMWNARGTFDQPWFAFYHHYTDPLMYSRHWSKFRASNLQAPAILIFPMMYIDNVVGAVMVFVGSIDMLAHQWYHTRIVDRRRYFGRVAFALLTGLERLGIINTREHMRIHHGHDVFHQEDVKGWMDVWWPVIGRMYDTLGDRLYLILRRTPLGAAMLAVLFVSVYVVAWLLLGEHALRNDNASALALHTLIGGFLIWMAIPSPTAATKDLDEPTGKPLRSQDPS